MIRSALKEKIPIAHLHCLLWWCWDCCSFSLNSQSSLEIQNNPNIVFCHLLVDDGLVAERRVGEDDGWSPDVAACLSCSL